MFKRRKKQKTIQNYRPRYGFLKSDKKPDKNAQDEKS
jgi:hypothetical protein